MPERVARDFYPLREKLESIWQSREIGHPSRRAGWLPMFESERRGIGGWQWDTGLVVVRCRRPG